MVRDSHFGSGHVREVGWQVSKRKPPREPRARHQMRDFPACLSRSSSRYLLSRFRLYPRPSRCVVVLHVSRVTMSRAPYRLSLGSGGVFLGAKCCAHWVSTSMASWPGLDPTRVLRLNSTVARDEISFSFGHSFEPRGRMDSA